MEFESDLYVSADGIAKLHQKTVRVNEPLSYAGFTFYQASFKPMASERLIDIEVADKSGSKVRHRVRLMAPVELPNKETLVVEKVYEDFAGLGQAIRLAKKSADGSETYFHVFRRYQDYDRVVRNDQFYVTFLDADQKYATGLSIGNVPGIFAIFLGFVILLMGLFMCFFMTPIRYFARIFEENGQVMVALAAQGFRNPDLVKDIFNKLTARIPASVHGTKDV